MSKWELVRVVPDQVKLVMSLSEELERIEANLPITLSTEERSALKQSSQWLQQLVMENRDLKAQVETLKKKLKDLPFMRI